MMFKQVKNAKYLNLECTSIEADILIGNEWSSCGFTTNCRNAYDKKMLEQLKKTTNGFKNIKPFIPIPIDISMQYINNYNTVDEIRRGLYQETVDPLIAEAQIKRIKGLNKEAEDYEKQALSAREKIQSKYPWPDNPL